MTQKSVFNRAGSPLCHVYETYHAEDPGELLEVFLRVDQELMHQGRWDYLDEDLLVNRIKVAVEGVGLTAITDEKEERYIRELLWLWYHHAANNALWVYRDNEAARVFALEALDLQSPSHPNQITQLLFLLASGSVADAESYITTIVDPTEKQSAGLLLEKYKSEH